MNTISPVYARFVLRELLHNGGSEQPLFAGTSLNRLQLETGGDITMADFVAFLENARKLSGDEQLGLLIGRHTHVVALGPVGAAAATAPTVREGLQVMENFSRLHASYINVELVSSLRGLSVGFRFVEDLGAVERFHAETSAMLIQHYVEMLSGQTLNDAEYRFSFEKPDYADDYALWLHSPVSFGYQHTSVELTHQWLDLNSPYFNADMWNQSQLLLAQQIRELGDSAKNPYTQHLTALMRSSEPPLPALSTVAARLYLSERTLNRRLQQEGNSFRKIRAGILNAWARQYLLETTHSVEAIAATLGYQDAANFRRAFRNQEACSPSEFRRGLKPSA